jgi:hypothetical protein
MLPDNPSKKWNGNGSYWIMLVDSTDGSDRYLYTNGAAMAVDKLNEYKYNIAKDAANPSIEFSKFKATM